MKGLLFDCYNGISGDMIVGALLGVGADKKYLENCIKSLKLTDFSIKITKNKDIFNFQVVLQENFDDDLDYLYHNKKVEFRFVERNLNQVYKVLGESKLSENAQALAKKMFLEVAKAEGLAHNLPIEKVAFHESGAMDSIIDIAAIAVCIDNLNIEKIYFTNLREGKGSIQTRKGRIPIPTPAVLNMAKAHDVKFEVDSQLPVEIITPTGMCGVVSLMIQENPPENYKVLKEGFGLGKRDYKQYGLSQLLSCKIIEL